MSLYGPHKEGVKSVATPGRLPGRPLLRVERATLATLATLARSFAPFRPLPVPVKPLSLALAVGLLGMPGRARAAEPDGPPMDFGTPPEGASAWTRGCSLRHPVCVHAPPRTPTVSILAALAAADRAWDVATGALALAPPDPEPDGVWHVYLVDGVDGGSTALLAALDPLAHFDRASSFALVDRDLVPGCALDFAVARAVARASLWRMAPATDEGSACAETQMLARLATPCYVGSGGTDDERTFQDEPERAVVDPGSASFDRGAALFFEWLDADFATDPGALVAGLWSLGPTRTPAAAWRWSGAPTGFDVLRVSLKNALGTDSTFDDILARFAVHRALALPPARVGWHIPWPTRGRRFASPIPVAPTGASYVLVDIAGSPGGAKLRVEATWEDFGRMRWEIVKLDAQGSALADVPVTSLPLGTSASMTVEPLDGVDRVLIVGANVGSTEHPFDPDQEWWEPHGWLLTVEGE